MGVIAKASENLADAAKKEAVDSLPDLLSQIGVKSDAFLTDEQRRKQEAKGAGEQLSFF